jgi:glycine dehydrogenase subunit 1
MLGKTGFVQVAEECLNRAEYLKDKVGKSGRFEIVNTAPTFNEFVVRSKGRNAQQLVEALDVEGVLAGVPLSRFFEGRTHDLMIAVTERHTPEDLNRLVSLLVKAAQ